MLAIAALAFWSLFTAPRIDYALAETIALPHTAVVLAYEDFDRDDRPDLVLTTGDHRRVEVHERNDGQFVTVATIATPAVVVGHRALADLDGDGLLELALRGRRSGELYILEAGGDDRYALRRQPIGPVDDPICITDTDDDERLELVVAQPGFPSRVHRIEFTSDGRPAPLAVLDAAGGGVFVACAPPNHPDPLRLVFADNHFWAGVARGHWLDRSGERGEWPLLGVFPTALADTDGDGRLELIGHSIPGQTVIVELGERARPRIVTTDPDPTCATAPQDYDGDGRAELVCTPVIDGSTQVLVRARLGDQLETIADPGEALTLGGDPVTATPIRDRNGDGRPELLVHQTGSAPRLHVLLSSRAG